MADKGRIKNRTPLDWARDRQDATRMFSHCEADNCAEAISRHWPCHCISLKVERTYYIYIMTNKWNRVLYTGVTGDIIKRVHQHREKQVEGFTRRYNIDKLVYFETCKEPASAIKREKQIKGGSRKKKIQLIESQNPGWKDLYPGIASLR